MVLNWQNFPAESESRPWPVSLLTEVNIYLNWAYVLSFRIYNNIPLKCQSNPFLQTPQGKISHQIKRTQNPWLFLFPKHHLYVLWMLIVNYALPTKVNEVCVCLFHFSCSIRDFPASLSAIALIYHQQTSRSLLVSSPLILMCTLSSKTVIFQDHFLNPLRFCFLAMVVILAQKTLIKSTQVWTFLTLIWITREATHVWGRAKWAVSASSS